MVDQLQRARGVGAEAEACAELGRAGRLLVEGEGDVAGGEGYREGGAGYAGADYGDVWELARAACGCGWGVHCGVGGFEVVCAGVVVIVEKTVLIVDRRVLLVVVVGGFLGMGLLSRWVVFRLLR